MSPVIELTIVSGPSQGTVVAVDRELVLGREGDVVIDDREASRRHAVLRPVENGVAVEDLGSANGTFVDDRRIAGPEILTASSRLRLGETDIDLRIPDAPGGAPTVISTSPAATVISPAPAQGAPPPFAKAAGVVAALAAIALIVLFALAAPGDSVTTHKVKLKIRTTELYFVGARIGFSGTVVGTPLGAGTITQDQTFGGRPQDILKGPTPVTAKVTCRFEKGTIVGTLRATATPTAQGGTHLDGRLTWSYGTGAYKHIKGSITTTGGRPDIRVPIAAFDTTGEVEY